MTTALNGLSGSAGLGPALTLTADQIMNLLSYATVPVTNASNVNTQLQAVVYSPRDDRFEIVGSASPTRRMNFEVDAQSSGALFTLNTGAQTTSRSLTVPVLTGNRTIALLNQDQTFTGTHTFAGPGGAQATYVFIGRDAGQKGLIGFRTGTSLRWEFGVGQGAESGSNAGSNLELSTYTDAGTYLDTPITIARAAGGTVALSRRLTVNIGTSATSVVQLVCTGTNGANITLTGDGATTPNKSIRVRGGQLEIMDSAYTNTLLTLTDAGQLRVVNGTEAAPALSFGGAVVGAWRDSNDLLLSTLGIRMARFASGSVTAYRASLSAPTNGTILGALTVGAYDGAVWDDTAARIRVVATENWTTGAHGADMQLRVRRNASNTLEWHGLSVPRRR